MFARRKVDWAVIETGMGGRMDATNVITPELAIITNISLEHREYLGATIPRIAFEKAGIVKRRRPVVTGIRQPSAWEVLRQAAQQKSAPVFRLSRDFRFRRTGGGRFTYRGLRHVWPDMATGLQGDYQGGNAALVLAACELLLDKAPRLSLESMRAGLATTRWPGRLDVVSEKPLIMLDGAHNLDAAKQLARHLRANFKDRDITLVVGILDDKPYAAMLKLLLPYAARVIATQAKTRRALPAELRTDPPLHRVVLILASDDLAVPILSTNADGSLTLATALAVGEQVRWAIRQPLSAEQDMRQSLLVPPQGSVAVDPEKAPDFALMFSCLGRGPLFYGNEDRDLLVFREHFPGVPLVGAYGSGQIAPVGNANRLFQNTVVTLLYESAHVQPIA